MIASLANYPVWQVSGVNGGLLIALIAVIHVFVSQFAVGGGFFLVMAERKGHREGSARILKWVHRHTRFFLLLTMVFGGMTGVGIWLIIALVSPEGTQFLVHEFLYAWATEWVFFLGEIIALLLYAASFARCRDGHMAPKDHMLLGWAYCLFAFLSLFIINGVISFMLTPGNHSFGEGQFWAAFFNPGFWPGLVFRSGLSLVLAGLFGLVTATAIRHEPTRTEMVRFCAKWVCLPFVLMVAGGAWSAASLPDEVRAFMMRRTADIRPVVRSFIDAAPVLFLAGMLLFIRLPKKAYLPCVLVMLALGLAVVGSYEWVRETARRPWLIYGHMYSNGITAAEGARMNKLGVLAVSGWAGLKAGTIPMAEGAASANTVGLASAAHAAVPAGESAGAPAEANAAPPPLPDAASLTGAQRSAFGKFLFSQQCSGCHGIASPKLDIVPRVAGRGVRGIDALLAAQGSISPYMPPFFGTVAERAALAEWLNTLGETGGRHE